MLNTPWRQKLKMGRIVEVCPQNHGNLLLKKLSNSKILAFILGPMAAEMLPSQIQKIPPLPEGIEAGIILCKSRFLRIVEKLTGTSLPETTPEKELRFEKAKDVIDVSSYNWNIFNDQAIVGAVIQFLLTGKF